ncbi:MULTISPECIES: hypothetical protein [Protofrankia]|uniref:YbaB/EbfC DNA-binding family protein n=1 Tax=Protofrankia coriariae TaxID=1562887 RepID=A0ABR5F282_9ACTN|nr:MULTISPECIES: hypothetical protein [Protofrankia]KLL10811.1 hypothetical protein FrCorBMG51_15445 [Protofrankia coriariae]ONH34014.1 hypothetical protein BL254_18410 [Protofrankia sp. BMG5.30]
MSIFSRTAQPEAAPADDLDARVQAAVRAALAPPADPVPVPPVPAESTEFEVIRDADGQVVGYKVAESRHGAVVRVLDLSPAERDAYIQAGVVEAKRAVRERIEQAMADGARA